MRMLQPPLVTADIECCVPALRPGRCRRCLNPAFCLWPDTKTPKVDGLCITDPAVTPAGMPAVQALAGGAGARQGAGGGLPGGGWPVVSVA